MIASLAMYDQPWLQSANDRLWSAVSARLRAAGIGDAPSELSRDLELEQVWRSPDLLLAQSCGYPVMTELRERVQLVATPHYEAEGCEGAFHRAAIIVRKDDPVDGIAGLRGKKAGINDWRSNTGMNLLRAAIAPLAQGEPFFDDVIVTGSHAASTAAVLSGEIDVASIDAVTLAQLRRYIPAASAVRVLEWTAATPALPLVTSIATNGATIEALRQALRDTVSDPDIATTLQMLLISDFEVLDFADYGVILDLARQAAAQGYPEIR